jgi:hypothetical protein
MRIGLHSGAWTNFGSFTLAGAGAVTGATAEQAALQYLGWLGMAFGIAILIWGITIDGEQWWKRRVVKIDGPVAALPLPSEWISLDDAIRYIGQKSQWVAEQNNNDPMFPVHVGQTLQDALLCGDLRARGRMFHVVRGGIKDPPLHPLEPIPADYWKAARLDAYWALQGRVQMISTGRGESAVRNGDHEGMHDIRLDRQQVETLWPPHASPANAAEKSVFNETIGEITTDRIPYARLRDIAHEYGVTFTRFGAEQNNSYNFEGALRQSAVDGDLVVWGRKYRGEIQSNDPLVRIPANHFEDFEFAHGNLDFDAPNIKVRTNTIHMTRLGIEGEVDVTFYDLHLANKAARDVLRAFGEGLKNGNA